MLAPWPRGESANDEFATDYWFDEPVPGDRRSWASPGGHGTYGGMDLEMLDPDDDDDLTFLMEAHHEEYQDALESDEEQVADGQPFSPRLHVTMHHIVAKQLLADDPPHTWQTAQRLAGLGYDWHTIMHMIASVVSADIYLVMTEDRRFDLADYSRRLDQLPGDWPPPAPSSGP